MTVRRRQFISWVGRWRRGRSSDSLANSGLFYREADKQLRHEGGATLAFVRDEGEKGGNGEEDRGNSREDSRELTRRDQEFAPFAVLIGDLSHFSSILRCVLPAAKATPRKIEEFRAVLRRDPPSRTTSLGAIVIAQR